MGLVSATKTIKTRLYVESGRQEWFHEARLESREIFNETLRLKAAGFNRTEIQRELDSESFLRNNKCAVVGKALHTWDSYQSLLDWWHEQDDAGVGKPAPPSTEKDGAFPLVMAYQEGYDLTIEDDTGRIRFRISPRPYKRVRGHLRGDCDALEELRRAIMNKGGEVGQSELLYRDGVYYLHVTVTCSFDVPNPQEAETLVGVDFNERNVALTALERETVQTVGTLVLDYGRVKAERQRYHTIIQRCQEVGKTSIYQKLGGDEERFTEWVLHRLSRTVVEFAALFSNPVIVFEDLSGIRRGMQYGVYMNRRLHKLPFNKFETLVQYKSTWEEIPMFTVGSSYNSQICSCCGERGKREGRRFSCLNHDCVLLQDHADRNASVNIVWRAKVTLDGSTNDYRTRKTQPQVRLVRLSGSGRVSRPTSSRSLAEQGVLTNG